MENNHPWGGKTANRLVESSLEGDCSSVEDSYGHLPRFEDCKTAQQENRLCHRQQECPVLLRRNKETPWTATPPPRNDQPTQSSTSYLEWPRTIINIISRDGIYPRLCCHLLNPPKESELAKRRVAAARRISNPMKQPDRNNRNTWLCDHGLEKSSVTTPHEDE